MEIHGRRYLYGLIFVTAAAVAWSTAGLFTRSLSVDTATILFWRGLFGAVGMAILISVLPQSGGIKAFARLGYSGLAYSTVTAVSMLFFVSALMNTSVAHVAVITAAVPFMAGALGLLFLRESPDKSAIMASALALSGVFIMVGFGNDGQLFGDGLAILMALCMAGMILISRAFPSIPALHATCLASLFSAVATLPFATLTSIATQEIAILAAFAFVNQVLGFGLFAIGARWLPPMETALITALDAPLAPLWVWLVFGETPFVQTVVGGVLVLAAVFGQVYWKSRSTERDHHKV